MMGSRFVIFRSSLAEDHRAGQSGFEQSQGGIVVRQIASLALSGCVTSSFAAACGTCQTLTCKDAEAVDALQLVGHALQTLCVLMWRTS